MKMRLDLSTKKEAPTKIHLGRFPLHPAPCTLHPEKGFTLLELLVSIAILSMVLVMIYGTLSMGSRAWEKGEEDIEKVQRMRVVMNLLSREIKSTFPYKITPSELDTHKEFYAFEGKKDSVSFVSTIPLKGGRRGLSWLSFWVESEEGLVVVERDALRSDIFKERDSIDELKSGKEEGEGEGEWKEHWDAEKEGTLPHAVKIELTFEEEGRREGDEGEIYYRELIIPLMIHVKKIRGRRGRRSDLD
jgi:general secretion pathway protein J